MPPEAAEPGPADEGQTVIVTGPPSVCAEASPEAEASGLGPGGDR